MPFSPSKSARHFAGKEAPIAGPSRPAHRLPRWIEHATHSASSSGNPETLVLDRLNFAGRNRRVPRHTGATATASCFRDCQTHITRELPGPRGSEEVLRRQSQPGPGKHFGREDHVVAEEVGNDHIASLFTATQAWPVPSPGRTSTIRLPRREAIREREPVLPPAAVKSAASITAPGLFSRIRTRGQANRRLFRTPDRGKNHSQTSARPPSAHRPRPRSPLRGARRRAGRSRNQDRLGRGARGRPRAAASHPLEFRGNVLKGRGRRRARVEQDGVRRPAGSSAAAAGLRQDAQRMPDQPSTVR